MEVDSAAKVPSDFPVLQSSADVQKVIEQLASGKAGEPELIQTHPG